MTTVNDNTHVLFQHAQNLADTLGYTWTIENGLPAPVDPDQPDLVENSRHWRAPGQPTEPADRDQAASTAGAWLTEHGYTVKVNEQDTTTTIHAYGTAGLLRFLTGLGGTVLSASTEPAPA